MKLPLKKGRQKTNTADLAVDKTQPSDEYKRFIHKPMAVDTSIRRTLIKVLTEATTLPNYSIIASHRAQYYGSTEPENSMEGLKALNLGTAEEKADIVELDIKISSDNQVYVMHDDYLQRTTDFLDKFPGVGGSTGEAAKYGDYNYYTWDQVRTLTLKKPDFSYTDRKVPLFRDVLRYMKNETSSLINLDINDHKVLRAVWDLFRRLGQQFSKTFLSCAAII